MFTVMYHKGLKWKRRKEKKNKISVSTLRTLLYSSPSQWSCLQMKKKEEGKGVLLEERILKRQ